MNQACLMVSRSNRLIPLEPNLAPFPSRRVIQSVEQNRGGRIKLTAYAQESSDRSQKRVLLETVHSNCLWDGESVIPEYRQPFDLIASAASMTEKGNCPDQSDLSSHPLEYPIRDSNPCYRRERAAS